MQVEVHRSMRTRRVVVVVVASSIKQVMAEVLAVAVAGSLVLEVRVQVVKATTEATARDRKAVAAAEMGAQEAAIAPEDAELQGSAGHAIAPEASGRVTGPSTEQTIPATAGLAWVGASGRAREVRVS